MKQGLIVALMGVLSSTAATGAVVLATTFEEGKANTAATNPNAILDRSGMNHHGTPGGNPTYVAVAFPGSALALKFGGTSYVRVPDNGAFALTNFTISLRFRIDGATPGVLVMRDDGQTGLDPYYISFQSDGTLLFGVESLTQNARIYSPVLSRNQWYQADAVFRDADGFQALFIDGKLVSWQVTAVRPFKQYPTDQPSCADPGRRCFGPSLMIGANARGGGNGCDCTIDDLMIADVAGDVPPIISTAGVRNAASGATAISSGSWISIYGQNLSRSTRVWTNSDFVNGRLPVSLDGVSVTVNGKQAYMYFVSPTQLNVLSPDDPALGSVNLTVNTAWGSALTTAAIQKLSPGWFMFQPDGAKYPAAVHLNGDRVGRSQLFGDSLFTRPVAPGDVIQIFGTGFGPTDPDLPSEVLLQQVAPLSAGNGLTATLGGIPAQILWAGKVASGEYQINLQTPANVPDGDLLLEARMGSFVTQPNVYLTVKRQ